MTDTMIPLAIPCLGGNEWKYVKECLDTGWISSVGPFVERFEKELARVVGAPYGVATVNGTAALHLALMVAGVEAGDEVLVPDLTFAAPVNAVIYANAHPVFIDADPKTWQIDVNKIESFLRNECELKSGECFNKKTKRCVKAVVAVHLLGLACEMDRIVSLAREFGLKVIEDAAEAMGVFYQGQHVGTFGDVGAFSFNGNKVITTGGGGMVVTQNKKVADYARYLSTQAKDDPLEYVHNEVGYNYRLTNIQAALGVAQLEQLDSFLAKKRSIAAYYQEALSKLDGIVCPSVPKDCNPAYWLYTVLLGEKTTLSQRKSVIQFLNENGVGARPFWHTLHDLPPFVREQSYQIEHSVRIYERGVCLPSSVSLCADDLKKVVYIFKKALSL